MCLAPKVPKAVPPAQFQQVQNPKDMMNLSGSGSSNRRRRGLYSAIFTSPQGLSGAPSVTGASGGITGG